MKSMAVNGITDICATVNVPKSEYENLIRESNTLHVVENLYSTQNHVDAEIIRNILGIELEERKGE